MFAAGGNQPLAKSTKRKPPRRRAKRAGKELMVGRATALEPVDDFHPVHYEPAPYEPVAEYYPPVRYPSPLEEAVQRVNGIEVAGLIGLCYVCAVGAFNAGYFVNVTGRFVELFSFSDVLGANIALVQYVFLVASTWCMLSIAWTALTYHFPFNWTESIRYKVESFISSVHSDLGLFLLAFVGFVGVLMVALALSTLTNHRFLVVDLLPVALFNGGLLYVTWRGFKAGYVSIGNLVVASVLGVLFFSFEAGKIWLRFDINTAAGVQSIFTKDNTCLDRKILRTSSNGLLLYNPSFKSFEFRSKEDLKVIYDRASCV